ncbi:hypothetical protein PV325_001439 [Microctonus aethiopoides]|nr:hypothetical protein PV325_001439 [Microctonus aethiopoides]
MKSFHPLDIPKKSDILSRLSTVQIVFNSSMLTCAMSICESRLVNAAYSTAASGHRCRRGIWMAPPLLADMVLVIHSLQALKEQNAKDEEVANLERQREALWI